MILRSLVFFSVLSVSALAQQVAGPIGVSLKVGSSGHSVSRAMYVPREGEIELVVTPAAQRNKVTLFRSGSYGGRSIAVVSVEPRIDSVVIAVSWKKPLIKGESMLPPSSAPLINPEWYEKTGAVRPKKAEDVQDGITPSTWYDPTQPHVRLETSFDGVAVILATDALAIAPGLANADTAKLVLFWRGREQHISIIDADASSTFSEGDTIVFMGRRAQGDTTWLDLQDTAAIFFLTVRNDGNRLRLGAFQSPSITSDSVRSVYVQERIELDTGYYHPGSDNSEDYSTFMTPMSRFEGFYWESLNGRAKQLATHELSFTPSGEGMVTISADVVASTDPTKYDPDHGIDLSLNGAPSVGVIGNGFVRYDLPVSVDASTMPSGTQSLRLFASGILGLELTPDWFSEVLLDAYTIKGLAAPLLDNGRLRGRITTNAAASLVLMNASPGAAFLIDTTRWQIRPLETSERGVAVRVGVAPTALRWPGSLTPSGRYRVAVTFDDEHRSVDDVRGFVVASRSVTTNEFQIRVLSSASESAAFVSGLSADEVGVIVCAGGVMTQQLRSALLAKGVVVELGDTLFSVATHGNSSSVTAQSLSQTRGLTWFASSSRALRGLIQTNLPRAFADVVVLGAGSGVERARAVKASLVNLAGASPRTDVIVVTHSGLHGQAQRWADFRFKRNGLVCRVVDVNDIFDEFDAGRHSPEAIRLFLKYAWEDAPLPKPTHCVLIGNASWDVRVAIKGGNARSVRPDLVPTYGKPSSDHWFGLLDDPYDLSTPELLVTRFPVLNVEECASMIDKIITADTIPYAPWQRRFLYVGGGQTEDEGLCQIYEDMLSDKYNTGIFYTEPALCIDTITVCKSTSDNPGFEIRQSLNTGVGLMNYIGHGGTEVFDIKGWDPEDLSNAGKYPVLATFSCLTGAFSNSSELCRNGQYLLQPNAGFVAAIGATGWQYKIVVTQLHTMLHEVLRTTSIRDLARLTYEAKRGFAQQSQQFALNATLQFNILGDPFSQIQIDTSTQVSLAPSRVVVSSTKGGSQIREDDDSVFVDVTVWSEGTGTRLPYKIRLRHGYEGGIDSSTIIVTNGLCRENTVRFVIAVSEKAGTHNLDVEVDPEGSLSDRRDDNRVLKAFDVFSRSLLTLEPDPYGLVSRSSIAARVVDILSNSTNTMRVEMAISSTQDTSGARLRSLPQEIIRDGSIVDWKTARISVGVASEEDVWLGVWATDTSSGQRTAISWTPILLVDRPSVDPASHDAGAIHAVLEGPTIETEPLVYDSASRTIRIGTYEKDIFVRSSGVMTADPDKEPILNVTVGKTTIIQSAFRTGINIVILGQRDTVPQRIRRYDTSPNPLPVEAGHSGFARECIAFLRDSIANSDRVVIAVCNESFTRFIKDGLLDSLKIELHRLGSRLCDSLTVASSFAFVGSRSTGVGMATEAWKGAPQYMVTRDSIMSFHYPSGKAIGPVIGQARRWESVSFGRTGTVRSKLYGYTQGATDPVLLDTSGRWAPGDNESLVRSVYYEWDLVGSESVPDVSIRDITASYEPLAQWIIEERALTLIRDTVLRGDTANADLRVRNARTHFSTPPASVVLSARDVFTSELSTQQKASLGSIDADEVLTLAVKIPSDIVPAQTQLEALLDADPREPEMYVVRDRCDARLTIAEDKAKPILEPYIDGRFLPEGGWVYRNPFIEIRLRDNSPLPIIDPERMIVFVNGTRIRPTSADEFQFLTTSMAQAEWPNSDIRAAVRFKFPLELGENLLIVRGTDATNNSDTIEVALLTSAETRLESVTTVPNPTAGPVTFVISLVTDVPLTPASMNVYDVQGRLVRTLSGEVQLGEGRIVWDGRGDAGETLAPAVYAWRLNVLDTNGGVKTTTTGTLVIVR
ncbi:MAG: C25 family cysteine peptidase [Candidatus Kapabacteria bacterium]|nr:C25 family cysteine peptidase [Candidatus Kapabacteria bacterium]